MSRQSHPPAQLIFFGDSLVSGYGLEKKEDSFPDRVAATLRLPMQRFGFPGETSADALNRLRHIEADEPALVILTFGGNDILRNVSLEETDANLRQVISNLQSKGHSVVFTEVLSIFDGERHDMYRKMCRDLHIAMVPDILDGLLRTKDGLQIDSIHPAPKGCGIIAQRIVGVLRKTHFSE